jgi:hypothetical protein
MPHAKYDPAGIWGETNLARQIKGIIAVINYAIQSRRRSSNCFITCAGKTDGPGAQIHAVMSTMLLATYWGLTYVHNPFQTLTHEPKGEMHWAEKWEQFVNLRAGELHREDLKDAGLRVIHVGHPYKIWKLENTLYVLPHCHGFAETNPQRYSRLIDRFVAKYQSSPKPETLHGEPGKVNIAVHIRRGDVAREGDNSIRYTDSCLILSVIARVRTVLDELRLPSTVSVYSDGRESEFAEFRSREMRLHLNECPFTTFHNLVSADILVMAKSSFSYAAAILSRGIKIYEPFWHGPMKDWLILKGHNGSFDTGRFAGMIGRMISTSHPLAKAFQKGM